MESKKKKKIWKKLISQKNEITKKIECQTKIKSEKNWYLKKKMKSQKKWNQKISEHSQCQCHIMSESS